MSGSVREILEVFGVNYIAIQGSTDDVDLIDKEQVKLIDQTVAQIINAIKEKIPKKIPKEQISFWIHQEGIELGTCAGCGEHYICQCNGINKVIDTITAALSEEGK